LRYVATESLLNVMHVNPTLAYKVNDKLSLGAGVVISRMDVDLKAQINQSGLNTQLSGVATVSPDGTKELSGKGTGWGYNLGLLFRPFEEHSLGVSYRSQIMTRIKGKTEFTRLTGAAAAVFGGDKYAVNTETNLNLPESLILGYAYKPGKWTFEADAEWVDYSSIRQTKFDFMNESNAARLSVLNSGNPVVRDWHSSWNFGVGANYKFNKTWQARAGYYYYSEVIPENSWDPSTPDSSRNGITLGGSYMLGSSVMIDLAYNTLFFQKRVVHNSVGSSSGATVNGNYETMAHIISLNATYKFSIGSSRD
jgi:long-chain fatty acid transport protein